MSTNTEQKIKRSTDFWKRTNTTPLLGYSLGSYFISKRFEAVKELLAEPRKIEASMLKVEAFTSDYLRMAEAWGSVDHDIVFTAAPFPGIPWMEAMLGCDVYSTGSSFVARATGENLQDVDLRHLIRVEWFNKYIEFTEMLQSYRLFVGN